MREDTGVMAWIRLRRRRSKVFETMGRRLMGRYEVTSVAGLPGLGIMMICANFQRRGKYWRRSILLNIAVSRVRAFFGMDLRVSPVSKSYPGVLCGLTMPISRDISVGVMNFSKVVGFVCEVLESVGSSVSSSFCVLDGRGVKTDSR
jgi:hypothetical protein